MADLYRPNYGAQNSSHNHNTASQPSHNAHNNNHNHGAMPQSDFTFQSQVQAQFTPINPPGQAQQHTSSANQAQQNRGNYQGNQPYRRPYEPIHSRRLLRAPIPVKEERVFAATDGPSRFKDPSDSSSMTEHDSSDSDSDKDENPSRKKTREDKGTPADGNSVPKWSNPAAFDVAPPAEIGKRKDFVQLIRKAKVAASTAANSAKNGIADNDDFISFNEPALVGSLDDLSKTGKLAGPPKVRSRIPPAKDGTVPSAPAARPLKRDRDQYESDLVREWQPIRNRPSVPWFKAYKSIPKDKIMFRFHNEIMDFYEYVMPTDHDLEVRRSLVTRIEALLQREFNNYRSNLHLVGSSPAGLYLPTADLDLVLVSESFENNGPMEFDVYFSKSAAKRIILKSIGPLKRIAERNTIQPIFRARTPIVKFVHQETGLAVDISFEKLDSIRAQSIFAEWKAKYPDMIYMVPLVKQFLLMRGLNDVHTGGLGGFSIICLVVSFLQLKVEPGKDDLGTLFLKFLDYYGNEFDLARDMISMDPPEILEKGRMCIDGHPEKADRLCIIDPNKSDNNISGGSRQVPYIFRVFSLAHKELKRRIEYLRDRDLHESFLAPLYAGNYQTYEQQKRAMARIRV